MIHSTNQFVEFSLCSKIQYTQESDSLTANISINGVLCGDVRFFGNSRRTHTIFSSFSPWGFSSRYWKVFLLLCKIPSFSFFSQFLQSILLGILFLTLLNYIMTDYNLTMILFYSIL